MDGVAPPVFPTPGKDFFEAPPQPQQFEKIISSKEYRILSSTKEYFTFKIEETQSNIVFQLIPENLSFYFYEVKLDLNKSISWLNLPQNMFKDLAQIIGIIGDSFEKSKLSLLVKGLKEAYLVIKVPVVYEEIDCPLQLNYIEKETGEKYQQILNEINNLKKSMSFSENDEINNNANKRENVTKIELKKIEDKLNEYKETNDKNIEELKKMIQNQEKMFNEKLNQEIEKLRKEFQGIGALKNSYNNKINNNNKSEEKVEPQNQAKNQFLGIPETPQDDENKNKINNNNIVEEEKKLIDNIINDKNNNNNNIHPPIIINDYIPDEPSFPNLLHYSNPNDLRPKSIIVENNAGYGVDNFEVFCSLRDNQSYLVTSNKAKINLEIRSIKNYKKIRSTLKGHSNLVITLKYFCEEKPVKENSNEYLISADRDKKIFVWDLNNLDKVRVKLSLRPNYLNDILSCLMLFNVDSDEGNHQVITSVHGVSDKEELGSTKIYSLKDGSLLNFVAGTHLHQTLYLIDWVKKNKKNMNNQYNFEEIEEHYIIELCEKEIIINNIFTNKFYGRLYQEPECGHYSGFIFTKKNIDFLCHSSENGLIRIWDLDHLLLVKNLDTTGAVLLHIMQWSSNYLITADRNSKSIIIVELKNFKIVNTINGDHKGALTCVKKFKDKELGECLLSGGGPKDNQIILWQIDKK